MQRIALALVLASLAIGSVQADTTVRIGHAGPTTGPLAHIGKDGENGQGGAHDADGVGDTIDGRGGM